MIASMLMKLGGNRVCGRAFCERCPYFSAEIKCRHCRGSRTCIVTFQHFPVHSRAADNQGQIKPIDFGSKGDWP